MDAVYLVEVAAELKLVVLAVDINLILVFDWHRLLKSHHPSLVRLRNNSLVHMHLVNKLNLARL